MAIDDVDFDFTRGFFLKLTALPVGGHFMSSPAGG